MRTIVPEYYLHFSCIAGDCVHNCCREGWEIGLDDAHAKKYKEIAFDSKSPLSDRVKDGVFLPSVRQRQEGARPHILMKENGICPFLNSDGLCDLILSYNEKILCQICEDHPRFRNYYSDHMEMGVGMCCEEAVRLLLEAPEPLTYCDLQTGHMAVPEHRKQYNEREKNVREDIRLDILHLTEYLLCLDSLEPEWKKMLLNLNAEPCGDRLSYPEETVWQKIREYLLFRHLKENGETFVLFSLQLIQKLYESSKVLPDLKAEARLTEILRVYSSEIEYSEEAMELLKTKLAK